MVILGEETPTPGRWADPTPMRVGGIGGDTPTPRRALGGVVRTKWDEPPTPKTMSRTASGISTPTYAETPVGNPNAMTPTDMTPQRMQMWRWEKEIDERNRPLADEELDQILPANGYDVINIYTSNNIYSFNYLIHTSFPLFPHKVSSNYYSIFIFIFIFIFMFLFFPCLFCNRYSYT